MPGLPSQGDFTNGPRGEAGVVWGCEESETQASLCSPCCGGPRQLGCRLCPASLGCSTARTVGVQTVPSQGKLRPWMGQAQVWGLPALVPSMAPWCWRSSLPRPTPRPSGSALPPYPARGQVLGPSDHTPKPQQCSGEALAPSGLLAGDGLATFTGGPTRPWAPGYGFPPLPQGLPGPSALPCCSPDICHSMNTDADQQLTGWAALGSKWGPWKLP